MTPNDIAGLCERLRAVESMRRHGGNTTSWHRNPDGPEAADLIERLAAMLAASPQGEGSPADAQGWRDIATAPRDGREIIAYSQDVRGKTPLDPFVSLCAWHPDAGFCTCELREVTHWMPFPPPPSADPAPH